MKIEAITPTAWEYYLFYYLSTSGAQDRPSERRSPAESSHTSAADHICDLGGRSPRRVVRDVSLHEPRPGTTAALRVSVPCPRLEREGIQE